MTTATLESNVIAKATAFPMERVLERYAYDQGITLEAAREHECELKRYLALCAMNPETRYGMKGPIDNLWHTFIMFTRDYQRFCQSVAGRFLHHEPTDEAEKRTRKSREEYESFLAAYRGTFGEPPAHLWPRLPESENPGQTADVSCTKACGCSPGGSCSGDDTSGDAE